MMKLIIAIKHANHKNNHMIIKRVIKIYIYLACSTEENTHQKGDNSHN